MIAAEAFASIDMALIFPFIFLRSRNTRDRLPMASERLPPALPWTAMTIEKKFVSAIGTRWAIRSTASGNVIPSESDSTTRRNSDFTGSWLSAATIRIAAAESQEPVKSEFRRVVESLSLGMTLPEAVERMAQRVPIAETNFFSIVIAVQGKAGGNLSEAMGNLSRVLRERKKMKGKISAMSMEAKASAAIIGAVPFLVVGALYVSSPKYVSLLWLTSHGRMISEIAIAWMAIGVAMMKKMIAFDF